MLRCVKYGNETEGDRADLTLLEKQSAKVGLAVSIEVASEDMMNQAGANAASPSVPF